MAFSPKTGLVYIPAQQVPITYVPLPTLPIAPLGWNLGVALASVPAQDEGFLLAWDPAHQREAWRVAYKGPWNGGVVTTAGNIVAQGDAAGNFNVYRADTGERLWSMFAQSGIIAAPSTFEVGGEQYIAVLSGWGGSYALSGGKAAAMSGNLRNVSRLLVFKLGGTAVLPPLQPRALVINPPPEPADAASLARGEPLYDQYCSACHGEHAVGGGVVPDLRASNFLAMDYFYNIVLDGALKDAGMASFKSALSRDDVTAIRNFVIHRANQDSKNAVPTPR
jgi:quinohemoprotein ethanol dehydrogenase